MTDVLHLPVAMRSEVKLLGPEAGTHVFEGYGSVFGNEDQAGDVVVKGAFADSLQEKMPKLLWQHDWWEPIGCYVEAREDDHGLYVKGQLATKGRAEEAYELLKMGAIEGLSIGFRVRDFEIIDDVRYIKEADLLEVSLVTFAANELARIDAVKAAAMTERDIERKLTRDAGFSRSAARALMRGGLKGLNATPGAGDVTNELKQEAASWLNEVRQWRMKDA